MPRLLGRRSTPDSARIVAPKRASPRSRGYDAKWDGFSRRLRREAGICKRCDSLGRVRICEVVDHKVPLVDGGEMWDRANLWCLCVPCHGWKAGLEDYARKTEQVHLLRFWCDSPEYLPRRFQEKAI